jgi:hypothetical protein
MPTEMEKTMNEMRQARGAGGTSGGVIEFLCALAMVVAGGWLISNQVVVNSGSWQLFGYNAFGLSLLPFLVGVGMLFFNGRSVVGWLLTFAGVVIVLAGVLANLSIYWRSASLFNTVMMWGLLAGGIGLLARSLRDHK